MSGIRVTVPPPCRARPRARKVRRCWCARTGIEGTIGGGALEWEGYARSAADAGGPARLCGAQDAAGAGRWGKMLRAGAVVLRFETCEPLERAQGAALWVWGAGAMWAAPSSRPWGAPLPHVTIIPWVDTGPGRFPRCRARWGRHRHRRRHAAPDGRTRRCMRIT